MKDEIENRYEVFFDIKEMDLESLNQSQEEGGRIDGEAGQSFVMIDAARIAELTNIMKYLCKVKFFLERNLIKSPSIGINVCIGCKYDIFITEFSEGCV